MVYAGDGVNGLTDAGDDSWPGLHGDPNIAKATRGARNYPSQDLQLAGITIA